MEYTPRYCDARSILLVNSSGILRRLFCPFKILCKTATGNFQPGMSLWVEEVATNSQDELLYLIYDKPYPHHCFEIKATF